LRILQLVSDWKWTGPAEPMVVLSRALRARGHGVELVCPAPPPEAGRNLRDEAAWRGLAPVAAIDPARSAWRPGDAARVQALARWFATDEIGGPFDLVHCWHSRDHVLAARALDRLRLGPARRASGPAPPRTRIVRSAAGGEAPRPWPWNRWLFGAACDGLLCASEASARAHRSVRPQGPLAAMPGAVEVAGEVESRGARQDGLERQIGDAPQDGDAGAEGGEGGEGARAVSRARARRSLGVPDAAILIGVVARMQPHRRFDLLLDALARLAPRHPALRLVVLGRGTRAEEVVARPARERGLADRVVLAGYRVDDYAELLAAMDLFTYLVPGSDGSCRALLEAAALGLPLVGGRRGAIPEIVRDGVTGILADETPASLAAAWEALIADPARRRALGHAARIDARVRFAPARLGADVEAFYAEVLRSAPISSR